MVGNFLRAEAGGVDHHDALVGGGFVVNVIEAVAADQDSLHALGLLDDLAGYFDAPGVYHDIRARHRLYGLAVAGALVLVQFVVQTLQLLLYESRVRLSAPRYNRNSLRHFRSSWCVYRVTMFLRADSGPRFAPIIPAINELCASLASRAVASRFREPHIFPFILRQVGTGGSTDGQLVKKSPEIDQRSPEFSYINFFHVPSFLRCINRGLSLFIAVASQPSLEIMFVL